MAISKEIAYGSLDNLLLDPKNPRLGRNHTKSVLSQDQVLDLITNWTLDELAVSYLESGEFWTHEALLVVEEEIYGKMHLVVVEGNRRLAALKLLHAAYNGKSVSSRWRDIAESDNPPDNLFTEIPYLLVDSREDVQA